MNLASIKIRAATVAAIAMACFVGGATLHGGNAAAQSTIPANLTKLRPIQGIAYDPKPSDFPQAAYYDSDFFNGDFKGIWGDDGQAGARRDLATLASDHINLLHLYNWNPQRPDHASFLKAADDNGIKVMIPISNFTAQTITGTTGCATCGKGYQAAYDLVSNIFKQVYTGTTPHRAAAMWAIYNEYDLNNINPVDVAFVVQAILTLEDEARIPPENRLPITSPVSDATFARDQRQGLSRVLAQSFERATVQWLRTNPGKNVSTSPSDLPGAVLAILAISNALDDNQTRSSYQSGFDSGPVMVSPIPADFWKTRFIASSNPFRIGAALEDYLTNPLQFQSAFPGTTAWNTLPPLFFGEMGFSQKDAGGDLQKQATIVLGQIEATHKLAVAASTPQGYFLGSCFFQHTLVDPSRFEGFDTTGQFATHTGPAAPYRVDVLTPLPVWASVKQGYAPPSFGMEPGKVKVTFRNYCAGQTVDVYLSAADGSGCTKQDTSAPVVPVAGQPNSYSASTNGLPNCAAGTRVEFTPGTNGDVSYDISTNGSYAPQPTPFFNVPVRILALQATAATSCALPEWNGISAATSLRGVSTQICADAQCPTAYQNPTSGPQFITRDTGSYDYVVEWCPAQNPSPVPTCSVPPFSPSAPCANVCQQDAVKSAFPCSENPGHIMCNVAPFGGTPPESYCLLTSNCQAPNQSCGCCTSNADCGTGACVNFVCSN
jgi:hypothetical protein